MVGVQYPGDGLELDLEWFLRVECCWVWFVRIKEVSLLVV